MIGPKAGWAGCGTVRERLQSLDDIHLRNLDWGWGWGSGGGRRIYLGCFANISAYTSAEAWASPSEVRAWVAFLYWPSSMARRARLALAARRDSAVIFLGFLRRWVSLSSSSSTSDKSPMMSPTCHLLILARTVFKVSRPPPSQGWPVHIVRA